MQHKRTYDAFGIRLEFAYKANPRDKQRPFEQLVLRFAHGDFRLELGSEARLRAYYNRISSDPRGIVFNVDEFSVGREGLNLTAAVDEKEPVQLAGVDQSFRFSSGGIRIKNSRIVGGSLEGSGPLPPALVGEANATVTIVTSRRDGRLVVDSATAMLDNSGKPLYSTGTRFRIIVTELGLQFVEADGYHFYFLLTGSAEFVPAAGEFNSGLLKNLKQLSITLTRAPLAADARELLKHIEFQVVVDPPRRVTLFDVFDFELRGIGFHPAFSGWPDAPPAIAISGQVSFMETGDLVSSKFDFHKLWIAPPGERSPLPRLRFDGLTLAISVGGAARVEGTALAVDGSLPHALYAPDSLPADVTAEGFLAAGRIDLSGFAHLSAAMGFLELRRKDGEPKHAFFLYGQDEKLSEPIPTPVGTIYLREVGFGFGYRYTLAGLAAVDRVSTPKELVRVLDDVSRYQGNLNTFQAWRPQYERADVTLALRGLLTVTAASTNSAYNTNKEKVLANPLLFDVVAALRTDLTFLINARAWVAVNYNDWFEALATAPWKENPSMRGYLYLSVPRREFLGRYLADPNGHIGSHPQLPEPLVKSMRSVRWSSTLYVRPGLFHVEFGWPFELGFPARQTQRQLLPQVFGWPGFPHRGRRAALRNRCPGLGGGPLRRPDRRSELRRIRVGPRQLRNRGEFPRLC